MTDLIAQESFDATPQESLLEEIYERLLPELEAVKVEDLVPVNLDVPAAVATVLVALPQIAALVPALAPLRDFDVERVRRLDEYAMALSHAHAAFLMASQPVDSLQPLVDEGIALRALLTADATALALRGLVDGSRLRDLRGPNGYRNLALDLQILASIFRRNFSKVQGKCATTAEEVQSAVRIAAGILRGVGLREQGTVTIAAAAEMRMRAFTVLADVYDQARRAIVFLRWREGDADAIAPPLQGGRGSAGGARADAALPESGFRATAGRLGPRHFIS